MQRLWMKRGWALLSATLLFVLLAGAVSGGGLAGCQHKGSGKPAVAVSIFPLYDIARRVAGDQLDVILVLPAGRSEHTYDPTPKEAARFADAKLGLMVGLGLDDWLRRIVAGSAGKGVKFIELGPQLEPLPISHEEVGAEEAEAEAPAGDHGAEEHEEHEEHHGSMDPHVWLDPVRMQKAVDIIVAAYSELDPPNAAGYKQRGDAVKQSLAALHTAIDTRAKAWSRKTIVTFHGSMSYFAKRYGLKIAAVIEPFPGKEPGPRYLEKVLDAVKSSGAAALFSEPQLDRAPARVIADRSGVPLYELDPVGGTKGVDTYEKLLTHNADELEKALK